MKSFILAALLFTAVPLRAQITLEHQYSVTPSISGANENFGLVQVDSNEWRYVVFNRIDTIQLFNPDHSFDRTMTFPSFASDLRIKFIAKNLFSLDSTYCYLIKDRGYKMRVFKEGGTSLFSCDTCVPWGWTANSDFEGINIAPSGVVRTPTGTKLIVMDGVRNISIYSLPGRLPGSSQMLSVNPNSQSSWPQLQSAAYPNPSQGRVRIAYDLPSGVQSGEIVLTTSDGREVKRYHITNAFSDLLIEDGDLLNGSYFYKLVTERGESPTRRIVREK
jgi:hypothetical protein